LPVVVHDEAENVAAVVPAGKRISRNATIILFGSPDSESIFDQRRMIVQRSSERKKSLQTNWLAATLEER
jgi:hypothetical protein